MTDLAQLDDAELVARTAAGDEEALGVLHDRHAGLAFGVARRLLADEGAAREVVQDAFVDLWRTAATFDPERAGAVTWLVRLVRLRAIDRARRDGAARRGGSGAGSLDVVLDEQVAATVPGPDDVAATVQAAHRAVRVREALAQLPADQRRVVELAFLEGLTHPELARLLELPVGTVKTRCFRGLARLAELLADEREGGPR